MLRRDQRVRTSFQMWLDGFLFALGYLLAHWTRFQFPNSWFPDWPPIAGFENYWSVWLVILPFGPLLLEAQGYYNRAGAGKLRETAWQAGKACVLAVLGVIVLLFFIRLELARGVIILFGGISWLLLVAKDELLRRWGRTQLGQSQLRQRFIVVGTRADTERLRKELAERAEDRTEVVAELNLNDTSIGRLTDLLHEHSPNGVILSAQHTYFGQIEKAIEVCELEGVEVWLLADFFKTQISQTTLDDFCGRPTLVFRSTPEASWQMAVKQLMDFLGAATLLLLLTVIPVLPIIALLIRIKSPGPILFRQQRSGLNGRPFTMLKFRTMVTDAEQRKDELALLNELTGPVFKLTHDPRVTPLGRFLRKYSFDELPQLWNVLRGEMSLVGPRPLPVDETRRFSDLAHRRRLSVKPGLTCLWQISGRSDVKDFSDWVRLDLEYIDNWSLGLDVKILLLTIPAVITGAGAK